MSKTKTTGKKEFAPNIGFWPAKSGNGFTRKLTREDIETLAKAEEGSRLLLSEVSSDNEKAPAFRLTVFPPDEQSQAKSDGI